MRDLQDYQRQHLLTMIEAAARAGRTESEIVAIVDGAFGKGYAKVHGIDDRRTLLDRLRRKAA